MDHCTSQDYFERRAREEQDAAVRSADDRARRCHRDLAERYLEAARTGLVPFGNSRRQRDLPIGPEFRIIE